MLTLAQMGAIAAVVLLAAALLAAKVTASGPKYMGTLRIAAYTRLLQVRPKLSFLLSYVPFARFGVPAWPPFLLSYVPSARFGVPAWPGAPWAAGLSRDRPSLSRAPRFCRHLPQCHLPVAWLLPSQGVRLVERARCPCRSSATCRACPPGGAMAHPFSPPRARHTAVELFLAGCSLFTASAIAISGLAAHYLQPAGALSGQLPAGRPGIDQLSLVFPPHLGLIIPFAPLPRSRRSRT
jgi:hypothetical protein